MRGNQNIGNRAVWLAAGVAMLCGFGSGAGATTLRLGCSISQYFVLPPYTQDQIRRAFPERIAFDFNGGNVSSGQVKGRVLRDTAEDILWQFEVPSNEGFRIVLEGQYNKRNTEFRIRDVPITDSIYPLGSGRGACVILR